MSGDDMAGVRIPETVRALGPDGIGAYIAAVEDRRARGSEDPEAEAEAFLLALLGRLHGGGPPPPEVGEITISRGGPGSGHWGHKGRPGERGGSLPSEGGPKEKVRPHTDYAQMRVAKVRDLRLRWADRIQTLFPSDEWATELMRDQWDRSVPPEGDNLISDKRWERYYRSLCAAGLAVGWLLRNRDLSAVPEEDRLALADLASWAEHAAWSDSRLHPAATSKASPEETEALFERYLERGWIAAEHGEDPFERYSLMAMAAAGLARTEQGPALDMQSLAEKSFPARGEGPGLTERCPEGFSQVLADAWRHAVGQADSPERALLEGQADGSDPRWYGENLIAQFLPGQWIPQTPTEDLLNRGWQEGDPSPGFIALQRAAAERFGGEAPAEPFYPVFGDRPEPGSVEEEAELLATPTVRQEVREFVDRMYRDTQRLLREWGFDEDDTVRLYRGMGDAREDWNPRALEDDPTGIADVRMNPITSWSFDPAVAYDFADARTDGVLLVAEIPVRRLMASAATGIPCKAEGEWLVVGGEPIRALVVAAEDEATLSELSERLKG